MADTKLSEKSAICIMINLVCNKLFILAPLYFKQFSGGSALIVTTLAFAISLCIWNLYCKFYNTSIVSNVQSRYLKTLLAAIISIISILVICVTTQKYTLSIKTSVLKETPFWITTTFFLIAMLTGAGSSLKSLGAAGIIFVPAIYIVALLLVIFSASHNDIYNFFPIIDTNNTDFFKKFLLILSLQFELIFLYFTPDFLENSKKTRNIGNSVIAFSYLCFLVIGLIYSISLPEVEIQNHEPFFRTIRMAHIGNISANFDSIFLILYCISAYIYLSSMWSVILRIINSCMPKKPASYFKYIMSVIIFVLTLSQIAGDYIYELFRQFYVILFIITFVLPSIFIITRCKKCKLKK